MENGCWALEQKTLLSELIQGMEMTKQLKEEIKGTFSNEMSRELLVQGILSSYEKALLMLQWRGSTALPHSPNLINGSPLAEEIKRGVEDNREHKEGSKKRKMMPKWTEQVTLSSENGLEGQHDDGYSWRKYGQKDILHAKFPRSYYRCTYRSTQNCWATKQVQRSDQNAAVFEITYRGRHTCSDGGQANPPLSSPEKQEQEQNNDDTLPQLQYCKENGSAFCFPFSSYGCEEIESNGLWLSSLDDFSLFSSFTHPCFVPDTLESSYGFNPGEKLVNYGAEKAQRSESDLTDIISSTTSSTNSPILDLDFSLDSVQIDPNFPFDNHEFFFSR